MIKYFIFILFLGVSFCAYAHEGRIIGGKPVDITQYPHQVSLSYKGKHFCGGVIIGDGSFILTAAHCLKSELPLKYIKVRVGSSYHNSDGEIINAAEYKADDKNDIAVLRLEKNIVVNKKAKPIKLSTNKFKSGQSAIVSGWGHTSENGELSRQLLAVSVKTISQSDCKKVYGSQILDSMFCAGVVGGGKDSCQGDSGGPLVINNVLIGIVSSGEGCGRAKYPGIYVNVENRGKWIKDTMVELAKK